VRFHPDQLEIIAQTNTTDSPPPDTGWQLLEAGVELRELDVATGDVAERIVIIRLDPAAMQFGVRYDALNPAQVSEWAAQFQPLLVFNGGYFTEENKTIGLIISEGEVWGTSLDNFAGLFAATADGEVSVRWLQEQPYDPTEALAEALQSFPVLVKPGDVMGFPAHADEGNPARRTVVAQDHGGNILAVVAPRGYLSLHELAVFLAGSDLEIDAALNLDGGGSAGLWLQTDGGDWGVNSITPVPSVVVVERR
jgi:exopolysaccharide biosynthesis protein